jgi:hypothetical protein
MGTDGDLHTSGASETINAASVSRSPSRGFFVVHGAGYCGSPM